MGSRYMKESGLYRLIAKSKMHFAEAFQDWVEEEVLPSIRKTGSYSVQPAAPAAKQGYGWLHKRLEGKELMRLKNAGLQQLIASGFGQTGCKLYACNRQNACNECISEEGSVEMTLVVDVQRI